MRFVSAILAACVLWLLAGAAEAEPIRLSGGTRADQTLLRDTLRTLRVAVAVHTKQECSSIEAIEFQVLPPSYKAKGKLLPGQSPETLYERWDVSFCGKKKPFLIGFWTTPTGVSFRIANFE